MARKPLSSTRAAALPQSSPGAWGDVRTASAWSRGGRTRPPRPPGSRKAAGGRGRMKTQVSGLPSFLNETLQTAVSWHQWAGPPELGCEGWKRRRRAPHRLPRPGQGPGRAGQSAGGDTVQRPQRGGGATRPPPATRETGAAGQGAATGHTQPQRPDLDAGTEAGGAVTVPGRLLAGRGGAVLAVAQLARSAPRGDPEVVPRGGPCRVSLTRGRGAMRTRGDSRPPRSFWPVTPHSSSCGPGQSAS